MTGNVNDGGSNVVIAGTNTKVGNAIDNVFVWSDKATGFSPTTPKTFYINTQ
ncbi:MAG: hypothetical protein LBH96_04445 [Candidatus Peribacteria bacterium]|nr:hypothetical protein [Candidatus Peribacteria bacterium]